MHDRQRHRSRRDPGGLAGLGLPGIIDVHTHFMPKSVMDKVWQYFDSAGPAGRPRVAHHVPHRRGTTGSIRCAAFGVRTFTSLVYPHKPDMAAWLNQWAAQFAARHPGLPAYRHLLSRAGAPPSTSPPRSTHGTRVFKAHIQVGDYDPNDPLLDEVWGADRGRRRPGRHPLRFRARARAVHRPRTHPATAAPLSAAAADHRAHGHAGVRRLPRHLPSDSPAVHLDTTMAFTAFVDERHAVPAAQVPPPA